MPASTRNLETHRLLVQAINAREVPEHLIAAGFHMENRVSAVTDYEYRGTTGLRDWMNDVFEVFLRGARYEAEEIIEAGNDFVVALLCVIGQGARSKQPLEFRWVGVTWFRDGRATRAVGYPSRREALQAVR